MTIRITWAQLAFAGLLGYLAHKNKVKISNFATF